MRLENICPLRNNQMPSPRMFLKLSLLFFFWGKGRGRENLFLFLNLSLRTVFKVSLPTNDTFNFPKTHPVIYLFNITVEKIPSIMSLRILLLFKANLRWQTHNWIDLIQ